MKLSALESHSSFALLGPGFHDEKWTLLQNLTPATTNPQLAYVAYESTRPTCWSGDPSPVEPVFDVEAASVQPELQSTAAQHREAVEHIRSLIAAGDVYQVNHTVRAHLPAVSGAGLLATLCSRGVPRFAAWVRFPDGSELVSASPELFFDVHGRRIHAEPMKGTAPSGQQARLQESVKDRAELAMITDLMRNDLTPLCKPHSVTVECARRFIELPYAVQAVSDVSGILVDGKTPVHALEALHPGGSVTGAPKRAAMEVIARLESSPRGAYCGALGLLAGDDAVFSLLIRTASRTRDGWVYGTGGGIVYDSNSDDEFAEVKLKLGALQCATRS